MRQDDDTRVDRRVANLLAGIRDRSGPESSQSAMLEAAAPGADMEKPRITRRPSVTVFGAGVTGLAAAHELIERGFLVQVLEPTESLDHYGHVEVGGMAASQYAHIPLPGAGAQQPMQRARRLFGTAEKIYFAPGDATYVPGYTLAETHTANDWKEPLNSEKLEAVAGKLSEAATLYEGAGEKLKVRIVGHTDDAKAAGKSRETGGERADAVLQKLKQLVDDQSKIDFELESMGSGEAFGDNAHEAGRARNNRVEFEIREIRLPGEHGYRFYPAFYHNLDDQLRRIPIYNEEGNPTRRSVLENLEPGPLSRFASWDREGPIRFPRKRPRSVEEFRSVALELYTRLGFPANDIAFFESKLFRFLTTSHERRLMDYSTRTWWDFVDGKRYSPVVQRHMRAAPQALVAMGVEETDAHTAGNIYLQLMLDQLRDGSRVDRAMNGPTSEAWLRHWKRYLDRQGAKFYYGGLDQIEPHPDGGRKLAPTWEVDPRPEPIYADEGLPGGGQDTWLKETDYYVLALPALAARGVFWDQGQPTVSDAGLDTTLRQVKNYDVTIDRDENDRLKGPLRDFVGIQFYFENDFKFAQGYNYYPDSDWGLSSISQLQFWAKRRTRDSGYLGILSVDIGDMHEIDTSRARESAARTFDATKRAQRAAKAAKDGSTPENQVEIALAASAAAEQARSSVDEARKLRRPRVGGWSQEFANALGTARDKAIAFAADPGPQTLAALAAAAGDVETCAAGLDPDARKVARAVTDAAVAAERALAALDQGDTNVKETGGWATVAAVYGVRAAESVRHGKTAWRSTPQEIADTVWRQIKLGLDPTLSLNIPDPLWYRIDDGIIFDGPGGSCGHNHYPFQINRAGEFEKRPGRLPTELQEVCNGGWVVAGMYTKTFTRLATMELGAESARHAVNAILHDWLVEQGGELRGDFCRTSNPEDDEVDDLAFLKRVDERLFGEGLPHFMDILGWEQAIEALTRSAHPIADLHKLIQSSVNTFRRDWNLDEMTPEEMRDRALKFVERAARLARELLGAAKK